MSAVNAWGVRDRPLRNAVPVVTAHRWGRDLRDVGDQAL